MTVEMHNHAQNANLMIVSSKMSKNANGKRMKDEEGDTMLYLCNDAIAT